MIILFFIFRLVCPLGCHSKTNLLSLPGSFFSRTFSHLRIRNRLRRGEALGVEQLDHGASSSLDGVISMAGSCRYSLEAKRLRDPFSICSLGAFFVRRIFKRRRLRVGVEELDQAELGLSRGSCTRSDGGRRVSVMLNNSRACLHRCC